MPSALLSLQKMSHKVGFAQFYMLGYLRSKCLHIFWVGLVSGSKMVISVWIYFMEKADWSAKGSFKEHGPHCELLDQMHCF